MAIICWLGWIMVGPFWLFSWIVTKLMNGFPQINVPQAYGTWVSLVLSVILVWALFYAIINAVTEGAYQQMNKKFRKLANNVLGFLAGFTILALIRILLDFESTCHQNKLPGIPDLAVIKAQIMTWIATANQFLLSDGVFFAFNRIIFPLAFLVGFYAFISSLAVFRKKWVNFVLSLCISVMMIVSPALEIITNFFLSSIINLLLGGAILYLILKSWKLLFVYLKNQLKEKNQVMTITNHITTAFFFIIYYIVVGVLTGILGFGNPVWNIMWGAMTGFILFGLAYYKYYLAPFFKYKNLIRYRDEINAELKNAEAKMNTAETEVARKAYQDVYMKILMKKENLEMGLEDVQEAITAIRMGLKRRAN